jgi:hypothetical protein
MQPPPVTDDMSRTAADCNPQQKQCTEVHDGVGHPEKSRPSPVKGDEVPGKWTRGVGKLDKTGERVATEIEDCDVYKCTI